MNAFILSLTWLAAALHMGGVNPLFLLIATLGIIASACFFGEKALNRPHAHIIFRISDIVILVFGLWVIVAMLFSLLPAISVDMSLTLLALPLTYTATRFALAGGIRWQSLISPLTGIGIITAFWAFLEFCVRHRPPFATFEDHNALCAWFNVLFFPAYASLVKSLKSGDTWLFLKWKLAWCLLIIMCITASTSTGGQICFAAGLLLATAKFGVRSKASLTALAFAISSFLPFYIIANQHIAGREATSRLFNASNDSSFQHRVALYHSALKMYEEGPRFGSGAGTFKIYYPANRSPNETSTSGDLAHNDYLQLLVELGPIAPLCLIFLSMMSLILLQQRKRADPSSLSVSDNTINVGYAIGALCLFAHAIVNFIFYVLPLSMACGLYLAKIAPQLPVGFIVPARHLRWAKRIMAISAIIISGFIIVTLGPRSIFIAATTESCQLRACRELRRSGAFDVQVANFLAVTQPGWTPAREFLVRLHWAEAASTSEDTEKKYRMELATREAIGMIRAAPDVGYSYALLAQIVEISSSLAELIPSDIPQSAERLYQKALSLRPYDMQSLLSLAKLMENQGKSKQAYSLVATESTLWWKVAVIHNNERIAALRFMIPRAVSLGYCEDARDMASMLETLAPTSSLAKTLPIELSASSLDHPGCSSATSLPEN